MTIAVLVCARASHSGRPRPRLPCQLTQCALTLNPIPCQADGASSSARAGVTAVRLEAATEAAGAGFAAWRADARAWRAWAVRARGEKNGALDMSTVRHSVAVRRCTMVHAARARVPYSYIHNGMSWGGVR